MASLMETLTQQLGGSVLKQISGQLGADEGKTSTATAAALPTLITALSRNAASNDGAQALDKALAKDHDGSIMDNLSGFFGNADSGPGSAILGHVLGGKQQAVQNGLGKTTGMDAASIGKLMAMLAPVVMGAIGKTKRQGNMDANGVASMLSAERQSAEQKAPNEMGLLGKMLDSDGDGDVDAGDIAKTGFGMLGKLFGR